MMTIIQMWPRKYWTWTCPGMRSKIGKELQDDRLLGEQENSKECSDGDGQGARSPDCIQECDQHDDGGSLEEDQDQD